MSTRAQRPRRQLTTWRVEALPEPGARGEDRMLAVIVETPHRRRPIAQREPGAWWPAPPKPARIPPG